MKYILLLLLIVTITSCNNEEAMKPYDKIDEASRSQPMASGYYTNEASRFTVNQTVHEFDGMYYAVFTLDANHMQVINLTKDSLEVALLKKQLK